MPSCMFTVILILTSIISFARASFVTLFPPSAEQCSNFTLNFTGNQISFPVTFILLPVNSSSPYLVQLPATAFDPKSQLGTYTAPIPFAAGTQFIAVMHDAQGVGNGGVSMVYTVGGSSNSDCLPQQVGNNTLAFRLSPSPPIQCGLQAITWTPLDPNGNGDDLRNVNITGYVLGGLAFRLNIAKDGVSTSALWRTSVPQGQNFMFLYERTDPATGNIRRETSAIQNVQPGSSSVCTQGGPSVTPAVVPPSTSNSTTQTSNSASGSTPTLSLGETSNNDEGRSNLPKPALFGIILGGVFFIATLFAFIFFYYIPKRCKRKVSCLEDDRQTERSNESHAALMKIDPKAPMGISLPPIRTSRFSIDSFPFPPYGTTAMPDPAQRNRALSPDAISQRLGLFGRMKGRQETMDSVASWGNTGPLGPSMFEPRPQAKSVPVDAMSDISEYSTPDFLPLPLPPVAVTMSRGGGGQGRARTQGEEHYPWGDSRTGGERQSSSRGGDSPAARDRSFARTRDSQSSVYSPTEPDHLSPLETIPAAGRASVYYPAPVQPPSRRNPLVQRRLSAYEGEGDDDYHYHEDSAGRTRSGPPVFRPAPDTQYGVAL